MGIKDVGGRSRPDPFSIIHDRDTDTTFTPLRGRNGKEVTYRATGPRVVGGSAEVIARSDDPRDLRWAAESQGALPGPSPYPYTGR